MAHYLHMDQNQFFKIAKNNENNVFYVYTGSGSPIIEYCNAVSLPGKIDPVAFSGTYGVSQSIVFFPPYDGGDSPLSYNVYRRNTIFVGSTGTNAGGLEDWDSWRWELAPTLDDNWEGPAATVIHNNGKVEIIVQTGTFPFYNYDYCGYYAYYVNARNCSGGGEQAELLQGGLETQFSTVDFSGYDLGGGGLGTIAFTYSSGLGNCVPADPSQGDTVYLSARSGYLWKSDPPGHLQKDELVATSTAFLQIVPGSLDALVFTNQSSLTGHFYFATIKEKYILGGPSYYEYGGNLECIHEYNTGCDKGETSFFYNNPYQ